MNKYSSVNFGSYQLGFPRIYCRILYVFLPSLEIICAKFHTLNMDRSVEWLEKSKNGAKNAKMAKKNTLYISSGVI